MNTLNHYKYIGRTVDVVMDRPLGSLHPKYGFEYPVNYGYIPHTISGDGEELVSWWSEDNERAFVFLPSYAELKDVSVVVKKDVKVNSLISFLKNMEQLL